MSSQGADLMEPNGIKNVKPREKCLQVNNTNKWSPWGSLPLQSNNYMGSTRRKKTLYYLKSGGLCYLHKVWLK